MKTSTGRATKAQADRWERFQRVGCICCRKRGYYSIPEVHHLLSGNRRRGHDFTIPLCPWHHRGIEPPPVDVGPSFADGSKPFRACFGSDDELLAETNKVLGDA